MSAGRVAFIPHAALLELVENYPNIGVALWRDAVVDGAVYRQWLVNVGRDRQQPADAGVRIFECKECGAARIVTG